MNAVIHYWLIQGYILNLNLNLNFIFIIIIIMPVLYYYSHGQLSPAVYFANNYLINYMNYSGWPQEHEHLYSLMYSKTRLQQILPLWSLYIQMFVGYASVHLYSILTHICDVLVPD